MNSNYSTAELEVIDDNEELRIINSYENSKDYSDDKLKYENEKEIKKNIEININGKKIPFSYYYKFDKKGTYIINFFIYLNIV